MIPILLIKFIDAQNTFCIPDFELFVAGQSGNGSVEHKIRLCQFIYRNLGVITTIAATMDTHTAMQIFNSIFWVDKKGEHPQPAITMISYEDVKQGIWKVNPKIAHNLKISPIDLENHALHYVKKLTEDGKYPLTIWPYHSMLGGIGHALVSSVEEALFFHNLLTEIQNKDPNLAQKVYLLEDCISPVVVPDIIDFTPQAEAVFQRFSHAAMHRVKSTDPIETWEGIPEIL